MFQNFFSRDIRQHALSKIPRRSSNARAKPRLHRVDVLMQIFFFVLSMVTTATLTHLANG
jgi:hypothetical protein